MNIIRSACVFVCLLLVIIVCVTVIVRCIKEIHWHKSFAHITLILFCVCIMFLSVVLGGDYVYPFERDLNPILIAEFDVPKEYELDYPGQKFWHGAYEKFGLYAQSQYFNPTDNQSVYGFGWPPMDFDKYCYIITYGQRIESLSYNVWETIDDPIRTGAKVGHMVLEKDFLPEKVYVYQIPKIRIENDVNDINRGWD